MVLQGKGAAPGAAVGSIYVYNEKFSIPAEQFADVGQEQSQLDRYLIIKKHALNELEGIRLSVEKVDPGKAQIFDAQKEIVEDIIINEEIPARILNERWAGDWAIYQVYETVLNVLRQTADPLIAERAADFDDVRALLLKLWYGQNTRGLSNLKEPVVIAARDLMPSDTAGLDRDKVLAILTETGGVTSHTAIIAKSYGIPAILGIEGLLNNVKQGQLAAVNAEDGTVILDPEENIIAQLREKSGVFNRDKQETQIFRDKESRTSCGVKIDIGLNISNTSKEELSAQSYTDSVGLFRTEFLFMGQNTLPSEEYQYASYKKVLESYGIKPVLLRALDIGGDKQLAGLDMKREENPFLGNRGLRLCFSEPDIFRTQIRAVLRASVYGNLWLMLPMVSSIDDIRKAKEIIAGIKAQLTAENIKTGEIKTGIMIEVPSIALIAGLAAKEVDFASIGSNDLCQYLCAADRMNSAVDTYYDQYHPAMFKLIKNIITAFNNEKKPLSICGELGSDIKAVPLLIGLGLRKLSMGAASVAEVKRIISKLNIVDCEALSNKVLEAATADEIERLLV